MAGNDANTLLLLHCDGADESTTVPDTSVGGNESIVTCQGSSKLTTAEKKFGTASLIVSPTGSSYIDIAKDDTNFDFATSDFTIDFWVYLTAVAANNCIFSWAEDATTANYTRFDISAQSSNVGKIRFTSSPASVSVITDDYCLGINAWHHVALVRSSDDYQIYVDGVAQLATPVTDADDIGCNSIVTFGALRYSTGAVFTGAPWHAQGWLDEIRVSKGIARWTEDFDVPTEEYNGVAGWGNALAFGADF